VQWNFVGKYFPIKDLSWRGYNLTLNPIYIFR
jgi:hypothetical protein